MCVYYKSITESSSYVTEFIIGSSEEVFIILGIVLIPFLLFKDSVGAKSDFLKIDLKSKGPASSS